MKKYKDNTKKVSNNIKELEERLKLNKYYNLSKILTHLKAFLYEFLLLYDSMRNLDGFDFVYYNEKYYKFIYEYQIMNYMKKDKTTISKKINILVTLGLIEKLNIYNQEISSNPIIKKALEKSKKDGKRCVNFYHIPNYTHKLLKQSDNRAMQLLDNKFTIKKFNKSFVINVFGQDFADRVFLDKRTIPKKYEKLIEDIKKSAAQFIRKEQLIKLNDFKNYILENPLYKKKFTQNTINSNINLAINGLIREKIIIKRKLSMKEKEHYHIEKNDKCNYILKGSNWKNEK